MQQARTLTGMTSPIPGHIEEAARAILGDRFGGTDWDVKDRRIASRKCDLYFLDSKAEKRIVVLKSYRDDVGLGGAFPAQRDALLKYHPLMKGTDSGFMVPELYGHDDAQRLLVMEWVEAPTLTKVLVLNLVNRWRQFEAIKLTGGWLRRFHQAARTELKPFDADHFRALIARRADQHADAAKRLARDSVFQAGMERFEEGSAALDGRMGRHTMSHGDFTPSNILISPRRVIGIDIWGRKQVPICTDMARMITYLLTTDLLPLRARFQPMPVEERPWWRAFVNGYGPDLFPDGDILKHLILFQTLARWLTLEDRIHERDKPFDNWRAAGLRLLVRSLVEA